MQSNTTRSRGPMRQFSDHSGMSSISPKPRIRKPAKSYLQSSLPVSSVAFGSPSDHAEEPLRGEVYKDLHERYLNLHKKVSHSKCELQRLRKEFASKMGDSRVMQQMHAEIDLDKKRSAELVNAVKCITKEIHDESSREKRVAIMRKHLHAISDWNPRVVSLLRFVESQVTLTVRARKPWAP